MVNRSQFLDLEL